MSYSSNTLHILLMDDDPEVLQQLQESLPATRKDYSLVWEPCQDFEEALRRISARRYDLVVTDVYRDQKGRAKGIDPGDAKGLNSVQAIRGHRFCPVVAFSDGSKPEGFPQGPFLEFADKSGGNADILAKLDSILETGIPGIAKRLHDELDGVGAAYMWDFLDRNWDRLRQNELANPTVTERLIRRRAATQLGRISPQSGGELGEVEGVEFYVRPKISQGEYRLGEIVKSKATGEFRVILTPHCHLTVQAGEAVPRADFVLTVKAVPALEVINQKKWDKDPSKQVEQLRRRIKANPEIGKPEGRYWFLPRFFEMPDLYCDFMRLESLPYAELLNGYEPFGVLDSPFAEAFQACFTKFYAAVGTGNLRPERFTHLIPKP
jgi:CheY-like chemotaxis protein